MKVFKYFFFCGVLSGGAVGDPDVVGVGGRGVVELYGYEFEFGGDLIFFREGVKAAFYPFFGFIGELVKVVVYGDDAAQGQGGEKGGEDQEYAGFSSFVHFLVL